MCNYCCRIRRLKQYSMQGFIWVILGKNMAKVCWKLPYPSFSTDIQQLMGCLLWLGKLDQSPYKTLLQLPTLPETIWEFTQVFCTLMGLNAESALQTWYVFEPRFTFVSLTVGYLTIPKQLKAHQVIASKNMQFTPVTTEASLACVTLFQVEDEELGKEFKFHSVFACPVSKEQSTADNPPMLMNCGHVLCKASVVRLARGGHRFKCPYCPQEVYPNKAIQIFF